jgi:hypothetical protein
LRSAFACAAAPALLVAAVLAASPDAAHGRQAEPFRPGTMYGGLHAGGTAYTDFLRTIESGADATAAGVRRLSARTTGSVGAVIEFAPAGHWALRLQGAWAPTRFEVIAPRAERVTGFADANADDDLPARLNVWTADLALLFHIPIRLGSTALYGVAGVGATEFRARPTDDAPVPADAAPEFAAGAVRRGVAVLGAGARIPLDWRDARLGFELLGHLGAPPVRGVEPEPERHEDRLNLAAQLRFQLTVSVPLFSARGLVEESTAGGR